jgi:hypothetical protein
VDIEELEHRNRRLLSYAEQAVRLKAAAAANRSGAREDTARLDAVCAICDTHLRRAAELLDQLRAQARRQLEDEGRRLQRLLERRRKVKGGLRAAVLDPRIARRRDRIARLNKLMSARNAAQAGGFQEMPLDEYAHPARREGEFSLTRANLLIAGATAVLLLVAASVTYFATRPGGSVQFEARRISARSDFIQVVAENGLLEPIRLHVPWGAARPENDPAAYGFDVFVRAPGEEEFRLLPDTGRAWIHEGQDFSLRESVEVAPMLRTELRLSLDALRESGPGFEAVRLVLTGAAGRTAGAAVFQ